MIAKTRGHERHLNDAMDSDSISHVTTNMQSSGACSSL